MQNVALPFFFSKILGIPSEKIPFLHLHAKASVNDQIRKDYRVLLDAIQLGLIGKEGSMSLLKPSSLYPSSSIPVIPTTSREGLKVNPKGEETLAGWSCL